MSDSHSLNSCGPHKTRKQEHCLCVLCHCEQPYVWERGAALIYSTTIYINYAIFPLQL